MFDPTIGRFTTEDPTGFKAGDPNLYRFVGNNPTNATDPTGKQAFVVGRTTKNDILDELDRAGISAYAVPIGMYPSPAGGKRDLYLILPSNGETDKEEGYSSDRTMNLANIMFAGVNKKQTLFYSNLKWEIETTDFDTSKLTKDQKISIFEANLVADPKTAAGSIGYREFGQQGWKSAGLGAVFTEVALKHGEEGVRLLNVAIKANFPINSDSNGNWVYEKEYKVGQIILAETKGVGPLSTATTVSQAAEYLFGRNRSPAIH